VAEVVATDITAEMLTAAKDFLTSQDIKNVTFKLADAENLPFEAETFHLVTCRIAPHHFTNCSRFVQEAARVLKSGGLLLVQDHVSPEERTTCPVCERIREAAGSQPHTGILRVRLISMFQKAELEVIHTEQIIKRHEFLPWANDRTAHQKSSSVWLYG